MFYSADEFYDDNTTSGPQRNEREINFDEAAAEARAPLIVESASLYDDEGPEPDGDEGLDLPDPLDALTDEQLAKLEAR